MTNPATTREPVIQQTAGVLGTSLQRLYRSSSSDSTVRREVSVSQSQHEDCATTSLDLTESLLEAVFEISEFDPLPHLNYRDDDFGFGLLTDSGPYAASAKSTNCTNRVCKAAPVSGQRTADSASDGLPGIDRRMLPRRE